MNVKGIEWFPYHKFMPASRGFLAILISPLEHNAENTRKFDSPGYLFN